MNKRYMFAAPFIVFMLLTVVLPLILLFWYAFYDNGFTMRFFISFFNDGVAFAVLGRSMWVALLSSVIALLIAYPIAYVLATTTSKRSMFLLMLFIMPMWVNTLLRAIALEQLFNAASISLGYFTLIVSLVIAYLPFVILPIFVVLKNIDKKYYEASADLGASPSKTFVKTILPLSVPGIVSGFLLIFVPAVSTYFFSARLGNETTMLGELLNTLNMEGLYGQGSVIAIVLLVIVGFSVAVTNRFTKIGNKKGGLF